MAELRSLRGTHPAMLSGAGLGLRRALLEDLLDFDGTAPDFLELAPENWIGVGGRYGSLLETAAERFDFVAHGLSLNIGGVRPLDRRLLGDIRTFLERFDCSIYSEHLSFCADDGNLYELLPLAFTDDMVKHVAARVRQVQEFMGRELVLENSSYYLVPEQHMTESAFIAAVLDEADCGLLLDVNNVIVNSVNHGYDASAFIQELPAERLRYLHIAGHRIESDGFRIDTHAADVGDEAWQLLDTVYAHFGPVPTVLERDSAFPPLTDLMGEVEHIRCKQRLAQMSSRGND